MTLSGEFGRSSVRTHRSGPHPRWPVDGHRGVARAFRHSEEARSHRAWWDNGNDRRRRRQGDRGAIEASRSCFGDGYRWTSHALRGVGCPIGSLAATCQSRLRNRERRNVTPAAAAAPPDPGDREPDQLRRHALAADRLGEERPTSRKLDVLAPGVWASAVVDRLPIDGQYVTRTVGLDDRAEFGDRRDRRTIDLLDDIGDRA
jgi:hypothetical protein